MYQVIRKQRANKIRDWLKTVVKSKIKNAYIIYSMAPSQTPLIVQILTLLLHLHIKHQNLVKKGTNILQESWEREATFGTASREVWIHQRLKYHSSHISPSLLKCKLQCHDMQAGGQLSQPLLFSSKGQRHVSESGRRWSFLWAFGEVQDEKGAMDCQQWTYRGHTLCLCQFFQA